MRYARSFCALINGSLRLYAIPHSSVVTHSPNRIHADHQQDLFCSCRSCVVTDNEMVHSIPMLLYHQLKLIYVWRVWWQPSIAVDHPEFHFSLNWISCRWYRLPWTVLAAGRFSCTNRWLSENKCVFCPLGMKWICVRAKIYDSIST